MPCLPFHHDVTDSSYCVGQPPLLVMKAIGHHRMAVGMVVPGEGILIVYVDVGVEISVGVNAVGVVTVAMILIDQEIPDGVDVAEVEVDTG